MASSDASYSEEAKLHASLLLQMGEWYKGTDWLPIGTSSLGSSLRRSWWVITKLIVRLSVLLKLTTQSQENTLCLLEVAHWSGVELLKFCVLWLLKETKLNSLSLEQKSFVLNKPRNMLVLQREVKLGPDWTELKSKRSTNDKCAES